MIWMVMREGTTADELDEDLSPTLGNVVLATREYGQAIEHAKSAADANKHPYVIAKVVEVARYRPRLGG